MSEVKVSRDPKVVKMFRKLEKFLDGEELGGANVINFRNAETGRAFATFVSPELFEEIEDAIREARNNISELEETIAILKDESALLGLIDAQNEVLMGRAFVDEAEHFQAITSDVAKARGL